MGGLKVTVITVIITNWAKVTRYYVILRIGPGVEVEVTVIVTNSTSSLGVTFAQYKT